MPRCDANVRCCNVDGGLRRASELPAGTTVTAEGEAEYRGRGPAEGTEPDEPRPNPGGGLSRCGPPTRAAGGGRGGRSPAGRAGMERGGDFPRLARLAHFSLSLTRGIMGK